MDSTIFEFCCYYMLNHMTRAFPDPAIVEFTVINTKQRVQMKKQILIISVATIIAITFSCSKSEDNNTNLSGTPGPKFLAAKSIITGSCALSGCHVNPSNSGGMNFESDANIVSAGSRIKARAVDQGTMPPTGALSAANKVIISDWINAGGRLTD